MSTEDTQKVPTAGESKDKNVLDNIAKEKQMSELATWVKDEYRKCKEARSAIEQQWYMNMSFYYGKQYVQPLGKDYSIAAGAVGKLYTPKAPPWRTRITINRIRPIIRTELARVTSQKPTASVIPSSSEDEDLFAAQAGEQIWESIYNRKKIHREFSRAMWWTLLTGTGYLKCWWDKEVIDATGVEGDITIAPVTPFHVFVPDLREVEIENQVYVINAYTRPVDVIKRQYGAAFGDKNIEGSVVSANEIIDDAYLNLQTSSKKPDSVLCYEMWLKPGAHKDFPKGGLIQVVDSTVVNVVSDGIPYKHGEYPFIKFDHIPTGKYYAESVIVDLISPQREFNRTRSQIIEAKNRMAKPQLIAPKGSIDPSKITTEPGIVIEYRPGLAPPSPLQMQPLPSYVIDELNRIITDMEDLSAQHATSKGGVPSGVTAATAISYLQEKDDSVLTHTYDSVEQGMEKLARQILSHVVQYWDIERTVKVVGDDGAFDTLVLKGADIQSGTDIRMESGTALPQSKAAKQAFLMDLMTRGFIQPDQGLRIMEIGGIQKLYDQLQVDERSAQRENLKMKLLEPGIIEQWEGQKAQAEAMAQGAMQPGAVPEGILGPDAPPELASMLPPGAQSQDPNSVFDPTIDPSLQQMPEGPTPTGSGNLQTPGPPDPMTGLPTGMPLLVPTNTWDNHAVHVEIHNRFRKGQAFEKLDDPTKRLFESHVKQHSDAMNAAAMQQMVTGPPQGNTKPPAGPEQSAPGKNQFSGLPSQE